MPAPVVIENIPFQIGFPKTNPNMPYLTTDELTTELKQLSLSAMAVGRPKGIYRESIIREKGPNWVIIDDLPFNSHILGVNLKPVDRVYPFIITSGPELEEWRQRFAHDELQGYWADRIVEVILQSVSQTLQDRLRTEFGLGALAMMNPGSLEDWPLEEQPKLFGLLGNPQAAIGVRLTENHLMEPVKSISGIFFENANHYENCRLCRKEGCPDRRASYDPQFHQREYQSS